MMFFKHSPSFLLITLIFSFLASCDRQSKYQEEKVQQLNEKNTPPTYLPIGHAFEKLPSSLNPEVKGQRQGFAEMLQGYEDRCLTLIQLYHPTEMDIEPVALCVLTEKKDVGIYQARACVVAIIDHIYQKPMPFYSEKQKHWGFSELCTEESVLKKINEPETLTTVNPVTYARMKLRDDGFDMQVVQDRLNVSTRIRQLVDVKK